MGFPTKITYFTINDVVAFRDPDENTSWQGIITAVVWDDITSKWIFSIKRVQYNSSSGGYEEEVWVHQGIQESDIIRKQSSSAASNNVWGITKTT